MHISVTRGAGERSGLAGGWRVCYRLEGKRLQRKVKNSISKVHFATQRDSVERFTGPRTMT